MKIMRMSRTTVATKWEVNAMRTAALAVLVTMPLLMIMSCADDGSMTTKGKTVAGGAAAGAVIGQAVGRNRYATAIGAGFGSLLGYIVGNEMEKSDTQNLNNALENGAAGNPISWNNPDTGDEYKIIPFEFFTDDVTQQKCRNAKIVADIEGKEQITDTKACRQSDGHWDLGALK